MCTSSSRYRRANSVGFSGILRLPDAQNATVRRDLQAILLTEKDPLIFCDLLFDLRLMVVVKAERLVDLGWRQVRQAGQDVIRAESQLVIANDRLDWCAGTLDDRPAAADSRTRK